MQGKGILFPDIIGKMIELKIFKSMSDFLEKTTRCESNKQNRSGHKLFRDIRKPGKNKSEYKQLIKDISQLLPNPAFKPQISDVKNIGNWFVLKSIYEEMRSFDSMKHMWSLSDYVIHLCDIEKKYINSTRKKNYLKQVIEYWEGFFFLDSDLCKQAKDSLLEVTDKFPEEKFNHWKAKNKKFLASVVIHQYLHLTAIYEQDTYYFNKELCTIEQFKEQQMIIRLLPKIDSNGNYSDAGKNLLSSIIKGLGHSTMEKFYTNLSKKNDIDRDTIKKQYDRIKLKKTPLTPKSLNTLLYGKHHDTDIAIIPGGLVIACRICDEITEELVKDGLELEWVIKEFNLYKKYQKQIKEKIRLTVGVM